MRKARQSARERLALTAALLSLSLGCCPGRSYSGPGEVQRHCWPFVNFEVLFDVQSMAPGDSKSWDFRRFPELDSVTGFTVSSRSGLPCAQLEKNASLSDASVLLELRRRDGSVVVTKSGPLRDWVWSYGGGGGETCEVYDDSLFFSPSSADDYRLVFVTDGAWPPDAALDDVYIGSYATYSP